MEIDELTLPEDTLKILNEFLEEKAQRERDELNQIEHKAGTDSKFEEDWQLSQFWYCNDTKRVLGEVVKQLVENQTEIFSVGLLSCPSLYATVKKVHKNVKIFEYDKRFAAYGADFVYYDFNEANSDDYLQEFNNQFDLIIADPPFLSEECICKISKIIKKLQTSSTKIIFCSGETVEPWLVKYLDLKKCLFSPKHERNLGNEFASFANFHLDDFIGIA